MDTLDQTTWNELDLASIYKDSINAIEHLKYNSALWEDIHEEDDKSNKDI